MGMRIRTLAAVALVAAASCGSGDADPSATDAPSSTDPVATEPASTDAPGAVAATDAHSATPATDPDADSVPDESSTPDTATTDPDGSNPSATGAEPGATDGPVGTTRPTGMDVRTIVETLASDEFAGRDNLADGSIKSQAFLVAELAAFAEPLTDEFLQQYELGANIVGVIPGGDLADEYVMLGAHYDHLGRECRGVSPLDDICNGATDNATGVAVAIEVARSIAAQGTPRRSVIVALWDGEEDGLVGSAEFVNDPRTPLSQIVAYLNFDIQGANLLPALANTTFMIGAETGGPSLLGAALDATAASTLDTESFSIVFGQGRSDHAVFAGVGVPSVFFTDANTGCYHTVKDDIDAVDFGKLDQQIATATALAITLAATDTPPVFNGSAPVSVHGDAAALLDVVRAAEPELGLLGQEAALAAGIFRDDLVRIVDAGPTAYDDAAIGIVLGGAAALVDGFASTECVND